MKYSSHIATRHRADRRVRLCQQAARLAVQQRPNEARFRTEPLDEIVKFLNLRKARFGMASSYFTKRIKALLRQKAKGRKRRPRTFKTEEAARAWAKARGLKDYGLVNLRSSAAATKKIRVVQRA